MKKYLVFFLVGFGLFACSGSQPGTSASQKLDQYDRASSQEPFLKVSLAPVGAKRPPSIVTQGSKLIQQSQAPSWVSELPGDPVYDYGRGLVDNCSDPQSCSAQGESTARNQLSKGISVVIVSETKKRQRIQQSSEFGQAYASEYQSLIQERAKPRELKEVSFEHWFDRRHKRLFTLAKMPKKSRFVRELEKQAEVIHEKLGNNLILGPFDVKGENNESLLSFYTGQVIQEGLFNLGVRSTFEPKKFNESFSDYLNRIDRSKPLVYGSYTRFGSEIKLTLFSLSGSKTEALGQVGLLISPKIQNLLDTSRLSITNTKDLKTKNLKLVIVADQRADLSMSNLAHELITLSLSQGNIKVLNETKPMFWESSTSSSLAQKVQEYFAKPQKSNLCVVILSAKIQPRQGVFKGRAFVNIKI